MNYTLQQIKAFHCIAKHKSITKASEELNLTQPAVSIQLKRFQDQFDIPLTEVIGRQLYLTDFGYKILDISEKILQNNDQIKEITNKYKGVLSGTIRVSSVSTGKYVLPYFISDFIKENPQVDLIVDVSNRNTVIEKLKKNETDIALVSLLPSDIEVDQLELMKNHLFLVASINNKSVKRVKGFKGLSNERMIIREQGSATRKAMQAYLDAADVSSSQKMELMSNEAVKQAVLANLGCSIMPLIGLKNELLNDQLQIVKMKNLPIETSWKFISLKSKELNIATQALLAYVKKHKEDIIKERFDWVNAFI